MNIYQIPLNLKYNTLFFMYFLIEPIYVFEKQDPTLPYRWSRFNNWADIKAHWLGNRFKVFKDNVDILVNDQKFDD